MHHPTRRIAIQNKRFLVPDDAGFIGSNLANRLIEDNDVIAVSGTYLGTSETLDPDVEFVEASVADDDLPADVESVSHLAAPFSRNMHKSDPPRGCPSLSRSS